MEIEHPKFERGGSLWIPVATYRAEKSTKGMYDEGCFNCRRDRTKCKKLHKFRCTRVGCNYVANAKSHFDNHIKSKHKKIRDLPCPKCDHMDSDATNLKRHIKKHGTDHQYKCAVCPYSTFLKQSWERHEVSKKHQINMKAAQVAMDNRIYDMLAAQGINPNDPNFTIVQHQESSVTPVTPPRSPSSEELVFQPSDETYPDQQSNNTPTSLITPPTPPPELPEVSEDFIKQSKLGHFMDMELWAGRQKCSSELLMNAFLVRPELTLTNFSTFMYCPINQVYNMMRMIYVLRCSTYANDKIQKNLKGTKTPRMNRWSPT